MNDAHGSERTAMLPGEQLTYTEAGRRLGLSANAVRMRCARRTLVCVDTRGGVRVVWPQPGISTPINDRTTNEDERTAHGERTTVDDERMSHERERRVLEQALADARADAAAWRSQAQRLAELLHAEQVNRALSAGTMVPGSSEIAPEPPVAANQVSGRAEKQTTTVEGKRTGRSLWSRFRQWYAGETRERKA